MLEELKPILAVETSESLCGACIYYSDRKYFEANIHLKNSHAEKLFEGIDFVIRESNVETSELGAIAVSAGPGSFTGLRIGMSAVKGIAFGTSLPVIPVPTFEAIALQVSEYLPEKTQFIVATKVNSEEIYYAKFQVMLNNYIFVENLTIISKNELFEKSKNFIVFGNIKDANPDANILTAPSPKYIAKWAKMFGDKLLTYNYDYLEPNYLKNFIIKENKK